MWRASARAQDLALDDVAVGDVQADALEIRLRAERRVGEMMQAQPKPHRDANLISGYQKTRYQSAMLSAQLSLLKPAHCARQLSALGLI